MGPITAPRTVNLGHSGCTTVFSVNGNFISGSSATNTVSFVKGDASSNVANAVTSYYCASNGGITNIDCQPCGPTGCSSGSTPTTVAPVAPTPVPGSMESDIALAITVLGMMLIAVYKMRKMRKT